MAIGNILMALLWAILWICIIGGVFWLLKWMITQFGLPEPFAKIANIVLAVAAVVLVIYMLIGLVGGIPTPRLR